MGSRFIEKLYVDWDANDRRTLERRLRNNENGRISGKNIIDVAENRNKVYL